MLLQDAAFIGVCTGPLLFKYPSASTVELGVVLLADYMSAPQAALPRHIVRRLCVHLVDFISRSFVNDLPPSPLDQTNLPGLSLDFSRALRLYIDVGR